MNLNLRVTPWTHRFLPLMMLLPLTTMSLKTYSEEAPNYWPVTQTSVTQTSRFDGQVEALHQATVAAQTSGRVIELMYDVGDFVEAGSTIARLTSVAQGAEFDRALSLQRETQARLVEARQNYQRGLSIFEKRLISQADVDQAEAAYKAAEAQASAADAAVAAAKENLAYTEIKAPYAGYVIERMALPGETVNPGSPIMSGISLEQLRVKVHIPQRLAAEIRQHRRALVTLPKGQSIDIQDIRIPPQASAASHTFPVLVDLPKGLKGLYPGTLIKMDFVTGSKGVIAIPTSALVQRGEVTAVYITDQDQQITMRYVRPGKVLADKTTILSGLEPGDRILPDPIVAARQYKEHTQLEEQQ